MNMTQIRTRGEDIRRFIIDNVENHPSDISKVAAKRFKITRQAINKHIVKLKKDGSLLQTGRTRNLLYKLAPLSTWDKSYTILPGLAEDVVWTNDIRPALGQLPDNVMNIWQHGFTEMFNNAIDHSEGTTIKVEIRKTASNTEMLLYDNGVGIFRKIQAAKGLLDERHALLELAKGKLTTDPKNHTGEGIFFTSRMFDEFQILSGGVYFSHDWDKSEDWLSESERPANGTAVFLLLHNHTSRTTKAVFDKFVTGDDYGFTKTVVPVQLAQYGNDKLISRSQARRVLARIELFKTVIFDFDNVKSIGPAFADEIFRVFANANPDMTLITLHDNSEVKRMIARAKHAATNPQG